MLNDHAVELPMNGFTFNVLRFEKANDEFAFFERFCLGSVYFVQTSLLLGSILVYVFYIWDKIIDPSQSEITHAIRGLILTPIIWICILVLFIPRSRRFFEAILTFAVLTPAVGLAVIFGILDHGFDYGAVGTVIILMFAFALLPVRIPYYALISVVSWSSFDIAQVVAANSTAGMFLINNLCLGTAVLVGMFSATMREVHARQQFITNRELDASRHRIDEFMKEMLPDGVVERMKARAATPIKSLNVVVSYRRSDTDAISGRIRDRLVEYFGKTAIFMDIDSIPLGTDFRKYIASALSETNVLLVVIGPNWLGAREGGFNRINDEVDPVRIEVETALQTGIPVLPVLVNGASMPNSNVLPEALKALSFINAAKIDVGRDFQQHMARLVSSIDESWEKKERSGTSSR